MTTKKFWIQTAERATKTFAQSMLALITIGATLTDIDWSTAASISGTAALVSVLTSITSAQFGDHTDPSLARHREE
ncbi:holin [Nocardia cyriacigeorgica]|uniref:Holin n=1 Tax=Nocardia cyriacigeorgica TaxID=135487 RepID=A0A5R8NHI6_9NOCA|nr:holin [Nocardia cyriacigeorgica]TLF74047.1 holin [Nocardia cyriacigeorgica]